MSTLLDNGFKKDDLACYALEKLAGMLEKQLYENGGIVGFGSSKNLVDPSFTTEQILAPGVDADADDTAVALLALQYLGRSVSPDGLIEAYEAQTHFKTYHLERNPSITVHCNILKTLLNTPNPPKYTSQIVKCANFIMEAWWMGDTGFSDKWVSGLFKFCE